MSNLIFKIILLNSFRLVLGNNSSVVNNTIEHNRIANLECINCVDNLKIFVKTYWFGLMGVEYSCVSNILQISKYSIISDVICNKSECAGLKNR